MILITNPTTMPIKSTGAETIRTVQTASRATAITNVSVNIMNFNVDGKHKRYIQVVTVMTDINYRNQGLSKFLMQRIFADWQNQSDLIYLFANSTVLNFYPKMGFTAVKEYEYFKNVNPSRKIKLEKLSMSDQKDRDKLY